MTSLTSLYCGWSKMSTNDVNNLSNTSIKYFSCPGLNLGSFNSATSLTSMTHLQIKSNSSMNLTNAVLTKLANLSVCHIDSVYATRLSLANMCNKNSHAEHHLKCGIVSIGGINTTPAILNILNGTATSPNTNFTTFSDYCGSFYYLSAEQSASLDSNLAKSLQTLLINGCYLSSLEGLHNLKALTSLTLSNNRLENYVTITNASGNQQTLKTCKYIVDSVPSTCTYINLAGNTDITDFSDLIEAGFTETSEGSRVFTR